MQHNCTISNEDGKLEAVKADSVERVRAIRAAFRFRKIL